jgi:ribonuclease HI
MAQQKYYVVWVGKKPGIYGSWPECQKQVDKMNGAKYKSYPTKAEAEQAFREGWTKHWGKAQPGKSRITQPAPVAPKTVEIDYDSISVDVGTREIRGRSNTEGYIREPARSSSPAVRSAKARIIWASFWLLSIRWLI